MPEEIQDKKESEEAKEEPKETEEGGIEVLLEEEKGEEEKQEVKTEVKEEPKEEVKQDSFKNKVYAQDRIISKLEKKIEELEAKKIESEPELDDLDKLAQTDWKKAVAEIVKRERTATDKEIQAKSQERERLQILQQNEQTVLSKYPELNETTSEHSQIWFDVLNKNPRWRQSPDGPTLVMREMEDVLRSRGYDIGGRATQEVKQERERLARVNATSLKSSRATPSNKVILSKEQREFCDINGVSYEEYARTLKKTGEGSLEL